MCVPFRIRLKSAPFNASSMRHLITASTEWPLRCMCMHALSRRTCQIKLNHSLYRYTYAARYVDEWRILFPGANHPCHSYRMAMQPRKDSTSHGHKLNKPANVIKCKYNSKAAFIGSGRRRNGMWQALFP